MFCCSATDVGRRLRCPSHSSEIGILIAQCYKRFVVEKSGNTSGSGSVGFNATWMRVAIILICILSYIF